MALVPKEECYLCNSLELVRVFLVPIFVDQSIDLDVEATWVNVVISMMKQSVFALELCC